MTFSDQNLSIVCRWRRRCPWCKLFNFHLLLKNHGPISTKLGTKHPCLMGIQVCSNEGPRPFPRGDNKEIAKIH